MFKVFSFMYLYEIITCNVLVYISSVLDCECWFIYKLLSIASFSHDTRTRQINSEKVYLGVRFALNEKNCHFYDRCFKR